MKVKTMAEIAAAGETAEILFWVGCAGSFDQRAQKITKAFASILDKVGISFAILGKEEMCTGDPARRAGNEFLFQMMAYQNIQVLNDYGVKKIVTTCPHCFNIFKNEYPALGGNYDVIHHTTFLQQLIDEGKLSNTAATQQVFPAMITNQSKSALQIAEELNIIQTDDVDFISNIILEVLGKYPEKVSEYQAGKKGLLGLFVGEVMKASKGKADPKVVNTEVLKALDKIQS